MRKLRASTTRSRGTVIARERRLHAHTSTGASVPRAALSARPRTRRSRSLVVVNAKSGSSERPSSERPTFSEAAVASRSVRDITKWNVIPAGGDTQRRARVGRSIPRIGIVARWSDALAMSGQMDLRERFLAVPVVTRSLMASTMVAVVLNPILGLDDIVRIPHDIVRKGQIWRLALSLFYVPGLFNALIMSFVLYRLASAWEQERGSLRLAYYFFLGVVATSLGVHPRRCRRARRPERALPRVLCGPGLLAAFLVLITRSSQGYAGASVSVLGLFAIPPSTPPSCSSSCPLRANPLESAASVAVGYAWAQGY